MSHLPKITDKAIRDYVGERSFTAGQDEFRRNALFDARRQGRTLKASFPGSADRPAHVRVTFDAAGIAEADCTCPAGDGGSCEHVAALLLNWRHLPKDFTEVEDPDTALERRSKPELIALVKQMLRQEPGLELLLAAPFAEREAKSASPETYARKAKDVFRSIGCGNGAAAGIAEQLEILKEEGDAFLRQNDYANAAPVYGGIAATIADQYDMVQDEFDEENSLGRVAAGCVQGLGQCLDELKADVARREIILRTLWEVNSSSVELDDLDEGPQELMVRHTTPEERRTIAAWVRAAMPKRKQPEHDWRLASYGRFLLELEADLLDDEAYLRICRETGRRHDLVERLLRLKRIEEALQESQKADDGDLVALAELFVRHRHGDVADRLVQDRAQKSNHWQVLEWARKRAAGRRDAAAVLDLTEKLFRQHPGVEKYREVEKLARQQGRWKELQPTLLAFLKKSHFRPALIDIYLAEGDIDQALEAIKGEQDYGPRFDYSRALTVARAAEKTRPQAALEIYRKQTEALIRNRSRGSYESACHFLKKVRDLYRQVGDETGWTTYVSHLRERHRALRALLDEMNKAKL
ncbi:MAG TPA: SWIM zinc finger family protein [Gemmataceae bacterium]|nr:SWIM zinc finger family protein [Gemmataceae bacterium]